MKTMIFVLLDRSGSMAGREADVIGGVNTFIKDQQELRDPAVITLARFDDQTPDKVERFRQMDDLQKVQPLQGPDFHPRGQTPLLDAVGKSLSELDVDWAREQPDRCIVLIATDGMENASREYTKAQVKQMIEARQDSDKWAFIFIGANIDSFAEAGHLGIPSANTANFRNTSAGIKAAYATVSSSVREMRMTGTMKASNLAGDIGEDGTVKRTHQQEPVNAHGRPKTASDAPWTPPHGAAKVDTQRQPWNAPV